MGDSRFRTAIGSPLSAVRYPHSLQGQYANHFSFKSRNPTTDFADVHGSWG
jgi:hypothetical protein